jgi:hypothetical protein
MDLAALADSRKVTGIRNVERRLTALHVSHSHGMLCAVDRCHDAFRLQGTASFKRSRQTCGEGRERGSGNQRARNDAKSFSFHTFLDDMNDRERRRTNAVQRTGLFSRQA